MSNNNHQQDLATQIREHHRSGELDKALEISARAMESNPADLKACGSRWELIAEMFPDEEAKERVRPEIESLLGAHPETPEVLWTAYWGYMHLPGRTKNVPDSLFDKIRSYALEPRFYRDSNCFESLMLHREQFVVAQFIAFSSACPRGSRDRGGGIRGGT